MECRRVLVVVVAMVVVLNSSSAAVALIELEFVRSVVALDGETVVSGSSGSWVVTFGFVGGTVVLTAVRSSAPSLASSSWLGTLSPSSLNSAMEPDVIPLL